MFGDSHLNCFHAPMSKHVSPMCVLEFLYLKLVLSRPPDSKGYPSVLKYVVRGSFVLTIMKDYSLMLLCTPFSGASHSSLSPNCIPSTSGLLLVIILFSTSQKDVLLALLTGTAPNFLFFEVIEPVCSSCVLTPVLFFFSFSVTFSRFAPGR